MRTAASPAAHCKPAVTAVSWPKLREEREDPHARIGALQLAQEVQRGVMAAVVDIDELEVEIGDGFKYGARRRWVLRMTASSSKQGTTTDRSARGRSLTSGEGGSHSK